MTERRRWLRYRAGPAAIRVLRERGLSADSLGALVGPASGPRWIILAALDRALLQTGLLGPSNGSPRPLLVGASAGAWRMLALAARDAAHAHGMLLDGYVEMRFRDAPVTPARVSEAYRSMLAAIFPPDEVAHLVDHPHLSLAAHTVRCRLPIGGNGSRLSKLMQLCGLGAAAALHAISRSGVDAVFERVLFHTRPASIDAHFAGRVVKMNHGNLLAAALASGTVPIYMQPQREPAGAPRGHYLDGGLTDYHLRQCYVANGAAITLFPHFQQRILPVWFDRRHARRSPAPQTLDSVLQLYPSDALLDSLPDGRIPDRDDFFRFADDPGERIRRWRESASIAERLGEQFIDDLERGRIADLAQPW